jgi:phosphodiesterase/alkaline phosphatase D-like protein
MPQFVLVSNNENNYDAIAESFNFAAVGDWGDNRDTYITAENIDFKNPEVVLGLGDYAYEEDADDIR